MVNQTEELGNLEKEFQTFARIVAITLGLFAGNILNWVIGILCVFMSI